MGSERKFRHRFARKEWRRGRVQRRRRRSRCQGGALVQRMKRRSRARAALGIVSDHASSKTIAAVRGRDSGIGAKRAARRQRRRKARRSGQAWATGCRITAAPRAMQISQTGVPAPAIPGSLHTGSGAFKPARQQRGAGLRHSADLHDNPGNAAQRRNQIPTEEKSR